MKKFLSIITILAGLTIAFSSCEKDLDTVPLDEDVVTPETLFEDPAAYQQFLAKLYAGLAVSGQEGPAGNGDISGIDEGFGQYLRGLWYMQELPTDEAIIAWNDQTIKDLHWHTWGTTDVFIQAFYYRVFYQISLCNEFLRETTDEKLSGRGVTGEMLDNVKEYRAEARFLRALSYWHALDHFGEYIPFGTEEDPLGDPDFFPAPHPDGAAGLFGFIESELKDVESLLADAGTNEYGRADKAAAWMLLAKIYLNAHVYVPDAGTKYTECVEYCDKIISSGAYTLAENYSHLFLADNDMQQEVIFAVNFDGNRTQTYGGTNFIIHAAVGGEMPNVYDLGADFGIAGGWGGLRATPEFVDLFPDETGTADLRGMFFTEGQTKEIENVGDFTNGYAITKWRNVTSAGVPGVSTDYPDTDFPMFRLADVYLMYAEASLNGAGDAGTGLNYVNMIRERAGADDLSSIDMDVILEERGRELYWECHRRTDLRRHGKYTGDAYIWSWKGNTQVGRSTNAKFELFPIPDADVNSNPNLDQNPNY